MLAVAGMRAFADTLLYESAVNAWRTEGAGPELGQLLGEEPHEGTTEASRLPLRA